MSYISRNEPQGLLDQEKLKEATVNSYPMAVYGLNAPV